MKEDIQQALDGRKNARLHSTQERAGEKNTAQNDIKQTDTAAEVPVIDENAALHAKEWVVTAAGYKWRMLWEK